MGERATINSLISNLAGKDDKTRLNSRQLLVAMCSKAVHPLSKALPNRREDTGWRNAHATY